MRNQPLRSFLHLFSPRRLFALAALVGIASVPLPTLAQVTPGAVQGQTATIQGTVQTANGAFIAGAHVQLVGPSKGDTVTDAYGNFSFPGVAFGKYSIFVEASGFGTASKENIAVNSDTTVTVKYLASEGGLKTIAQVTTSARTAINVTPASIMRISPSDYAFQGQTSWHRLLENIPGVSTQGFGISGDNPDLYVAASPFFPTQFSLNGSEPYETATLLDGMPMYINLGFSAPGNGTNLSGLPMNSFGDADIVRGPGADSSSIVNSVGGTFVLHAPSQILANHVEFALSNDPYGGYVGNSKVQFKIGRLSAQVIYGFNNSNGPINGPQIPSRAAVSYSTVNGQPLYCPSGFFGECINYLQDGYDFLGDAQYYGYPVAFDHFQVPLLICCYQAGSGWNSHQGSVGLSYKIGSAVTAQVFWAAAHQWAEESAPGWLTTFSPGSLGTGGGPAYTGSIPPGDYILNGLEYQNFAHSTTTLLEEKVTANLGRSVVRAAALQGYSFYQQELDNAPFGNFQVWGTACVGGTPTTCTPTTFNGTVENLGGYDYGSYIDNSWTHNRDLSLTYDTQVGSNATFGASWVQSYYDNPASFGYTIYPYGGTNPAGQDEVTSEFRIHAGSQISDKLSLSFSQYIALVNYHVPNPTVSQNLANPCCWSDVSMNDSAPRLGLTWRASPDISLRAAAGGGFAIAPLGDMIGSNFVYCSTSVNQCYGTETNVNLQPERSFGWDLGADVRLHHNTVVSADIYRNNLYGQIFYTNQPNGTYNYLGQDIPLFVTEYRNFAYSIMEGINLDARHDVPRGVYWHAGIGLTRGYLPHLDANFYNANGGVCSGGNLVDCQNLSILPNINFTGGNLEGRVPYSNGNAQIGYRWSPQKFIELAPKYYGKNNAYYVPAFAALDIHAGYPVTKDVTLYGTFQNVTGVHDELYAINTPNTIMGIPTLAGTPTWEALPSAFGPRTFLLTVNFSH